MSTVFAKISLRDFFRIRVSSIPSDAADGFAIPKCSERTPLKFPSEKELVWYFVNSLSDFCLFLAYGSNLSNSTFRGRRKQRPLKIIQATAPGYVLRFDLQGIPYQEPAFSGIRPRTHENDPDVIGIAYLLTRDEYERLLLSEGGRGGGYMEIDVPVKSLEDLTNINNSMIMCKSLQTREPRENPCPFPSPRYLSLLRGGAAEHKFPSAYREYLDSIPVYTISSWRPEIGRIIFLLLWLPVVVLILGLLATQRSRNGETPEWLIQLQHRVFGTMWAMHDKYFSRIFGRGDVSPDKETLWLNDIDEKC